MKMEDIGKRLICEARVERIPLGDKTVYVWLNPSVKDLDALTNRFKELRGAADDENMYVWNAFDGGHLQLRQMLGVIRWQSFYITDRNISPTNQEWYSPVNTAVFDFGRFLLYLDTSEDDSPIFSNFLKRFPHRKLSQLPIFAEKQVIPAVKTEETYMFEDSYDEFDGHEYGGWITPDKKIHHVNFMDHLRWARTHYGKGEFAAAYKAGAVRFLNEGLDGLSLQGTQDGLRNTFFAWSKMAMTSEKVFVDIVGRGVDIIRTDSYRMPMDRSRLLYDMRPAMVKV